MTGVIERESKVKMPINDVIQNRAQETARISVPLCFSGSDCSNQTSWLIGSPRMDPW